MTTETKAPGPVKKAPNKNTAKGFEYKVKGQYWSEGSGGKSKKFYEATFLIPEIVKYKDGLKKVDRVGADGKIKKKLEPNIVKAHILRVEMHFIQRYLLEAYLKDHYEDYIKFRTCTIVNKKRVYLDPAKYRDVNTMDFDEMNESELFQFHMLNDLNTDLDTFGSLADRKIAVRDEWREVLKSRAIKPKTQEESMLEAPKGANLSIAEDEDLQDDNGVEDEDLF